MAAAARGGVQDFEALLAQFGSTIARGGERAPDARSIPLGWPELDEVLPDHGLPRGVIELAAPRALGGATSIALAAMRAAHAKDARAWCAWVVGADPLYAPGVAEAGVDLGRLLVIDARRRVDAAARSTPEVGGAGRLERVAVKVAASGAFDVIAVDASGIAPNKGELFVRKLAVASDKAQTILLLTDQYAHRPVPWPVALRLELVRRPESITVSVAKDKRGRIGLKKTVPLRTRPTFTARDRIAV